MVCLILHDHLEILAVGPEFPVDLGLETGGAAIGISDSVRSMISGLMAFKVFICRVPAG
jgi:hypothetical protein